MFTFFLWPKLINTIVIKRANKLLDLWGFDPPRRPRTSKEKTNGKTNKQKTYG